MSLRSMPEQTIPEETARVARRAFPRGNRYLAVRDALGPLFDDARFAALYSARGRPAESPWRLALICVFQASEGLTDRQAAEAVQGRIEWKDALGLDLADEGFHFSVLGRFRDRLLAGTAESALLDAVLEHCKAHGYLPERGRQRTDATHVLGLVRTLNRLERVGEMRRAALTALATADPAWLQGHSDPAWAERYGRRVEEYRLPKGEAARAAYGAQIGVDGLLLLAAVADTDALAALRRLGAVERLRQVWVQQYVVIDGAVRLRTVEELPPSAAQIVSPYEEEVRFATKRQTSWVGDKVQLTETVTGPEQPQLITQVTTTLATTADVTQVEPIQQALADADLLPAEHVVDTAYLSGHTLTVSAARGIELLGPMYADHQWQAKAGTGFALADVTIDWAAQTATCPQGHESRMWSPYTDAQRGPLITVAFAAGDCVPCPVRDQCTRAVAGKPRQLTLRVQPDQQAIVAARERQQQPDFAARYAARAGIEGTLSQGLRTTGLRQARYRGLAKTHLQELAGAAAINRRRIHAHLLGRPRATTRRSPLRSLLAPAA